MFFPQNHFCEDCNLTAINVIGYGLMVLLHGAVINRLVHICRKITGSAINTTF